MSPLVTAYLTLFAAIVSEVIGSAFLQRSAQFTKLVPTAMMVVFYVVSFYLLSLALRALPLGFAYAIWAGLGIVLTASIGFFVFKQSLDTPALVGIGFIITGVLIMNLLSHSTGH
ncbi:MAG: quaternary ammonium transporter [Cypionkella sp.]|uniref:DMT family transporter n=1 Tax=Cypionkella sp. TaxID=2811411 RepID=UPI0026304D48|nr:multidrug efflux SMR transporter [Cypionkella sp.]MDB5660438.1 quaternary ammonium transporter [Cypionkella sp.]MDB5666401.1 quaternary ammonium transporter [Cypionkella sp.]